ncbi:sigma-70 family RNA polymerase sigma factor [Alkalinema sp. FACHB-956]|uniref:sigma-70 family RNA polymerase sigma factor n=1 Tax=Alkalinema sp. FACHB-956 TaxID=2692768 RepID=UPI0016855DD5|nr:sigma-70 family RNA polymerase sigma factor [Alkalinema sp. FACHB-956]MBD2329171.1 sigma-70 family RNA polymerase sigma factor [Alkalinema sp. FACHB-956]
MLPLDQELNALIEEARQHPRDSIARKRILNRVAAKIQQSGKLLKKDSNQRYYEDAVMDMWVYFMNNVCEATTANSAYDPAKSPDGSVITWLNVYLNFRLKDSSNRQRKEDSQRIWKKFDPETNDSIDPIDNLADPNLYDADESELIQILRQWLTTDPDQKLSQCYPKNQPLASCKTLIQARLLPPEIDWKDLAQELNLPLQTLHSHFRRHCLKLLQAFCHSQGFYD